MYLTLSELPHDHRLRNTPLGEVHAEFKLKGGAWARVSDHNPTTARCTYNTLGSVFRDNFCYRAPGPSPHP